VPDSSNNPTKLQDNLLQYTLEQRAKTYRMFCVSFFSAREGSDERRRYHKTLDHLALLWQLTAEEEAQFAREAKLLWQEIQESKMSAAEVITY